VPRLETGIGAAFTIDLRATTIFSFAPKVEVRAEQVEYRSISVETYPEPPVEYTRPKTDLELEIERLKGENHRLICGLIEIRLEQIEYGLSGLEKIL